MTEPELIYERHAQGVPEDRIWEQVRRTQNGKPLDDVQIQMIVDQCRRLIDLKPQDRFVDFCCGNGALTARVFHDASGGVGVDIAKTLIGVARKHFRLPGVRYVVSDVVDWVAEAELEHDSTKALLYGSINFLPPERVPVLLKGVHQRFTGVERFVIGNIADRDRLKGFFREGAYVPGIEDDPASAIGYWWSPDAFCRMAEDAGWQAEVLMMPEGYVARHYRFDLVLTRE